MFTTFSHNVLRKYVIIFGTLFNDIYVTREDSGVGGHTDTIKIPLSYGPKEKFLSRLEGDPTLTNQVAMVLPRMSFEMTAFQYDAERKRNTLNKIYVQDADPATFSYQYSPVPYNINFRLSIMTKNVIDGTKIVEQILPYFTPAWTPTVQLIPEMGASGTFDVPIILTSVSHEDTYEGDFIQRRALIWTLEFTMKAYVFGPVKKSGLIKFASVNLPDQGINITTTPGLTVDGMPTSNSSLSIPYISINATDNYGFIHDITENL